MILLNLINIVQAHEKGATKITTENTLGPVLAFVIIIAAIIITKWIRSNGGHLKKNQF